MPKELLCQIEEFEKSHLNSEVYDFIESLYSYITIIDSRYEIIDIDLEKSWIQYRAIIKINNKYYSFEYYDTIYWNFNDRVDANAELIEVEPVEVKEIKYKQINNDIYYSS